MSYTCRDCLYANLLQDGGVDCDKRVLLSGKMCEIKKENADKPCPAHSSKDIENWRYVEGHRSLKDCSDICEVCNRLINLNDITQYGFIEIQDESGKVVAEKMQCKICRHKGRR